MRCTAARVPESQASAIPGGYGGAAGALAWVWGAGGGRFEGGRPAGVRGVGAARSTHLSTLRGRPGSRCAPSLGRRGGWAAPVAGRAARRGPRRAARRGPRRGARRRRAAFPPRPATTPPRGATIRDAPRGAPTARGRAAAGAARGGAPPAPRPPRRAAAAGAATPLATSLTTVFKVIRPHDPKGRSRAERRAHRRRRALLPPPPAALMATTKVPAFLEPLAAWAARRYRAAVGRELTKYGLR